MDREGKRRVHEREKLVRMFVYFLFGPKKNKTRNRRFFIKSDYWLQQQGLGDLHASLSKMTSSRYLIGFLVISSLLTLLYSEYIT